jgi:hypothetical protein
MLASETARGGTAVALQGKGSVVPAALHCLEGPPGCTNAGPGHHPTPGLLPPLQLLGEDTEVRPRVCWPAAGRQLAACPRAVRRPMPGCTGCWSVPGAGRVQRLRRGGGFTEKGLACAPLCCRGVTIYCRCQQPENPDRPMSQVGARMPLPATRRSSGSPLQRGRCQEAAAPGASNFCLPVLTRSAPPPPPPPPFRPRSATLAISGTTQVGAHCAAAAPRLHRCPHHGGVATCSALFRPRLFARFTPPHVLPPLCRPISHTHTRPSPSCFSLQSAATPPWNT